MGDEKRDNQVAVRLTDAELAELDEHVETRKKKSRGHEVTRADVLREAMSYLPKVRA